MESQKLPPKPVVKEKTAREKAMEFAKNNVPKPKTKPKQEISKDKNIVNITEEDDV